MAPYLVEGWCPVVVTEVVTFTSCAVVGNSVSYCAESSHYPLSTTPLVHGTTCPVPATVIVRTTVPEDIGIVTPAVDAATRRLEHPTPVVAEKAHPTEPTHPTQLAHLTVLSPLPQLSHSIQRPPLTPLTHSTQPTHSTQLPPLTPTLGECHNFAGLQTWGKCEYDVFCGHSVDGPVLYSNHADSLESCAASCYHVEECRYVNWSPHSETKAGDQSAHNCFIRAVAEKVSPESDAWGALKVSCQGGTTVASTSSPRTSHPLNPPHSTPEPPHVSIPHTVPTSIHVPTFGVSECPQGHCSTTSTSKTTHTITKSESCPPSVCRTTETTLTTTTGGHSGRRSFSYLL